MNRTFTLPVPSRTPRKQNQHLVPKQVKKGLVLAGTAAAALASSPATAAQPTMPPKAIRPPAGQAGNTIAAPTVECHGMTFLCRTSVLDCPQSMRPIEAFDVQQAGHLLACGMVPDKAFVVVQCGKALCIYRKGCKALNLIRSKSCMAKAGDTLVRRLPPDHWGQVPRSGLKAT